MDAIRKIEAALAAGPTEGEWSVPHYSQGDVECNCTSVLSESYCGAIASIHFDDGRSVHEGGGDDPIPSEAKANGMLIAACCPTNIREVLQTLASKEAELAAREAEIAQLRELLAGCRAVFALALDNGKGEQYASLETRRGSFIHCVKLMQDLDAALTQQTPKD